MAAACYYCGGMPAVVYCRANAAGLCLQCDRHVHGANTVSSSHALAPLCTACRRGGAARFVCSDCNFEERDGAARGGELEPPLHDRGTVEGYTRCPTRSELAAILSVHGCEKAAADGGGDEGWWPVWEEPQVLSLDDVIVPTTSCHGLQPLLTSSLKVGRNTAKPVAVTVHRPKNKSMMVLVVCKNRTSPCEELNGEVLRQLAKSEAAVQVAAYVEAEPAGGDQLPPWASSEYGIGHGDFRALGTEVAYEAAASISVPSCEHGAPWIATDCTDPPDARDAEAAREQVPASSSAEPTLSSFVEISDIVCPSMNRSGSSSIDVVNGSSDHPSSMAVAPAQGQPKNGGYDIAYPDRSTVISRYKEKRKNRRFGKQIRYESRKARADSRLRINGRFAKSS